jgi:hypothetical protein
MIEYKISGNQVEMDIGDCQEFLMGYRLTEAEWKEEREESHFVFTADDFGNILNKTGFKIEKFFEYPFSRKDWKEWTEDV